MAHAIPKAVTLSEILETTKNDPVLQKLTNCLQQNKWTKDHKLKQFFKVKDQLTIKSGIILKDLKIVIPKELQKRVLKIAHEGHQGMTKTKLIVRGKVWWPGIDQIMHTMP